MRFALKTLAMVTVFFVLAVGVSFAAPKAKKAAASVDPNTCYQCHETIKDLRLMGKHKSIGCENCHSGIDQHLQEPKARPKTDMSWEACGKCHKDQYDSFMQVGQHRPARDDKSQLTGRSPNPFFDKLMAPHGFTKEHATTRSHVNMLIDQTIVDRAYGGRFQPKNGWMYIFEKGKMWDVLKNVEPGTTDQKIFLQQTATAANPVCVNCKTMDHILDWAYMGDPVEGAKWSRTSKPVEFVQEMQHGLNCFFCHDPHAAKPRIVRDALIDVVSTPKGDSLWHQDPNRTKVQVIDMGVRGFVRKIGILEKYDTRLICGQCHVEYNCNPGTDSKTGEAVKMTDRRTNHFPFKDVMNLYDHYVNKINFIDFKNRFSGAPLWKAQHPEVETYYNSKHSKAGVGCDDCHTPKITKGKKTFTSHFAQAPRFMVKDTCLKCHTEWSEHDAKYAIDSIKGYTKGRMRKAEFWLDQLIDKIVEGQKAGLSADVIKSAQDQHLRAHILWEYWTAENSDGFHNPEMARESLTKSIDESQKGIKIVDDALKAQKTAAAAPAPASATAPAAK